jgi:hypothetical protein
MRRPANSPTTRLIVAAVATAGFTAGSAAAATTALPAAPASTVASSVATVRVIAACSKAVFEPTHYVIACADAGIQLKQATYVWWTRKTAHGNGVYVFNDCKPSCAAGTLHSQHAVFTLYRVVMTSKFGPLFSRIEIDTRRGHHVFSLPTSTL